MKIKHLAQAISAIVGRVPDAFPRHASGLPAATDTDIVQLRDNETFDLRATMVRKQIGDAEVKMFAYNGSIPGPTLKVAQGAEVTVNFTNETELDATVHWHGLRLDNEFDGVPQGAHHGTMPPVPPGGSFTYRLRFPDPGVYWYHPHLREDYAQELGMYGNIIVVPGDPSYWAPVGREFALALDDILIEGGRIAAFSRTQSTRTAMGRYGNVMLLNGDTKATLEAQVGEVVRLYLTSTANVRPFNFRVSGARMKLVGGDSGRVEREEFIDEVLLAPSERAVVDALFERAGRYALEHRTPDHTYLLGEVVVADRPAPRALMDGFLTLRQNEEFRAERRRLAAEFDREPDKTLALVGEMPGMKHNGAHQIEPIEWEDTMALHNRMTTPENMIWKLVDRDTGAANHDIQWLFRTGERVKIRIVNDPHSDHPMQHPIHIHGQRFLVLSRDGVRNDNLAWKDTVLVRAGETADILLDASNPGAWMVHCHIAEHLEGGMMFTFHVR